MSNTLPLPEPWDYCYEWNGPFGTRKFSAASYNGNRPDRSVPIYTADQMHAHAAAVSAADNAALTAEVGKLKHQLWVQDACNGRMAGDPPRYTAECVVLRERVKVLEDARPEPDCRTCASYGPFYGRCNLVSPRCTNGDRYEPLPPVRLWRTAP